MTTLSNDELRTALTRFQGDLRLRRYDATGLRLGQAWEDLAMEVLDQCPASAYEAQQMAEALLAQFAAGEAADETGPARP